MIIGDTEAITNKRGSYARIEADIASVVEWQNEQLRKRNRIMKKKYFFKIFEKDPERILQSGYAQIKLENGIGEIETTNDEHKAMIERFGGVEYQEEEKKETKKAETKSDKKKD
jgi:hypothetical protein